MKKTDVKYFRRVLLDWFESNQRDFPWRKEGTSNYELILSEILLQRTMAGTVSKYYFTFFDKYPNWGKLISASIQDLEDILKPLGLYRQRAIRLSKIIQEYKDKNGIMPQNKNELQESSLASLYMSNAYELFILKHRSALLDVNMSRILNRFFCSVDNKNAKNYKLMQELAKNVINVKNCKELNWAILDYGALVCTALKPKCFECKLNKKCIYFALKTNSNNYNDSGLIK